MTFPPPPPPPSSPPPPSWPPPPGQPPRKSSPVVPLLVVGAIALVMLMAGAAAAILIVMRNSGAFSPVPPIADTPPVSQAPPPDVPPEHEAAPPAVEAPSERPATRRQADRAAAAPVASTPPERPATPERKRRDAADDVPVERAVRVGGQIRPPAKIRNVPPVYPQIAQSARVQGVVIIEATIDRTGKVTQTRVLRSIPLLDQAALDAVRKWEYEPTLVNGVAVPVIVTITVRFTLE
jgi:periplasmic protein TonB